MKLHFLFHLALGLLPALGLAEDLPHLRDGHWYSRTVDAKRGVVVYHDTYMAVEANGEVRNHYIVVKESKIPKDYKPGDFEAKLPALPGGSWFSYSESDGVRSVFENYYVYDAYGLRMTRSRFLLQEPMKMPEPKVTEAPKETETAPAVAAPTDRKAKKGKRLSPSLLGAAPLVGEAKSDLLEDPLAGSEKAELRAKETSDGPEPLVSEIPHMATSLEWNQDAPELSAKSRASVMRLLRATGPELSRWQFDLSKRFLTCTEGKCLVRDRGKGKIEVPFQVGLGRIWALSLELDRLAYAMEGQRLSEKEEREQILQLVQRLDSLQALLEFSRKESKSNYAERVDENLLTLKAGTRTWNIFTSQNEKTWALRWQVLARDAGAFVERADRLNAKLPSPLREITQEAAENLTLLLKEAGPQPWEKSDDAQYELAKTLYFDTTAPLRKAYRDFARHADTLRDEPQNYIDLLVLMGTAENLGVYGWTIMDELAEK